MASAPPQPPPLIGALLRVPLDVVREKMADGMRTRGFEGLHPSHLRVLQYPGPDGMRPSELAAELSMTRQALNYLLGQMEDLGYLERREDPTDGRSTRIALTDRGRMAGEAMREIVGEVEDDWERGLGPERFAELRGLLLDLSALVGGPTAPFRPGSSASPG